MMASRNTPNALIVIGNPITASRIQSILKQRGWSAELCMDGDQAVDEYVRLKPNLVFIGLDLPTMDGHVAALEMRESDPTARIVFVTSRTRRRKAGDAAFSAGAVAVLTTPLTQFDFDENWNAINGPIPEAPGLADLDELYPELEDKQLEIPKPPLENSPLDGLPPIPAPAANATEAEGRGVLLPFIIGLLLLAAIGTGTAYYLGYIEV